MEIKTVADINHYSGSSINPLENPEQLYELYSVPSFETGYPEIVKGKDIGSTKITVEEGDVLVCKINPRINRVWVVKHNTEYPLLASSEWIVVRNKNIDANYLKWYFSSPTFRTLLNSQVAGIGGSLTRAQPKQVAKYSVPVPSRSEQQRISKNLDKVNELITLRKEQLAKLDQLVKSRFVELMDSAELSEETTIEQITERVKVGFVGTCEKYYTDDSGIPMLRTGNITDHGIDMSDLKYVTAEFHEKNKKSQIRSGDLLIARHGSNGQANVYDGPEAQCLNAVVIVPNSAVAKSIFLAGLINSPDVKKQIDRTLVGSTQHVVNTKSIANLVVRIPRIEVQEQYEAFVEQTDKSKLAIQQSLDKLELLKKSLMQEYFG